MTPDERKLLWAIFVGFLVIFFLFTLVAVWPT